MTTHSSLLAALWLHKMVTLFYLSVSAFMKAYAWSYFFFSTPLFYLEWYNDTCEYFKMINILGNCLGSQIHILILPNWVIYNRLLRCLKKYYKAILVLQLNQQVPISRCFIRVEYLDIDSYWLKILAFLLKFWYPLCLWF